MVDRNTDIRVPTISDEGVRAKLAGTLLEPYTYLFIARARVNKVDPNWALSYLQWESGFGRESPSPTNPFDITGCTGWGVIDCVPVATGFAFAVYPTIEVGIEAGFRLWSSYHDHGWTTWFKSLCTSLHGNDQCRDNEDRIVTGWVDNVIAQGDANARQWPYLEPVPEPPPPPVGQGGALGLWLLGIGFLTAAAVVLTRGTK